LDRSIIRQQEIGLRKTLWGIDLGGTKAEGVVLDAMDDFAVLSRLRIPTESKKGYVHIVNQIHKLIKMLETETGLEPDIIGIGTPGTLDPITQTLKNSNTVCLNDMPLKKDLEEKCGLPFKIANDANCFAMAETHLGAVKEAFSKPEAIFGVIMGSGVGGGLVVNGRVVQGRQGIAGEWGHNFLDESGGLCYCGKTGCVETVISGPALERYYQELDAKNDGLSLKDIVQRHLAGSDKSATETVQRLLHFFGKAIAVVINIVDPDVILLGGGVGNIELLYAEGVEQARQHIFNNRFDTVFLKPKLGDSAGVFGAAMLVL
jgi:fructokinase